MSVARNNAAAFCLFFLVSVSGLILSACESPGSVGGSLTDPGIEVQDTVISVTDIQTDSFTAYSGRLSFFSAGQFNDPLYGNIRSLSLIKPRLPNILTISKLSENLEMNLKVIIDSTSNENIYGDTLSSAEFDLIEIDEIWRSRAWQLDDEIALSQNQVGSFRIDQGTDSIDVALSPEWTSRYRAYYNAISANRDSLYLYDFHGLAVVPRNESKIIPFNTNNVNFEIIDNDDNDTSAVSLSKWAYSIERTGSPPLPNGSSETISTFEKVFKFNMDLSMEELGTVNISRVELVVFQNENLLESSIVEASSTAMRPPITSASLYLGNSGNLPELFRVGDPISIASYNESVGSYRFDITRFTNSVLVDGINENDSFYITVESNNGIINSGLLYDNQAPEGKRPKLIVTYIKKDS